jgi:hypothetical protein
VIRAVRSSVVLAAMVLAGLLIGACGGSSNSSSTSSEKSPTPSPSKAATYSVDACKLVTQDDASAIAGGAPVTNLATSGGASFPGACVYGSSDQNKPATVFVYGQAFADATSAKAAKPEQIAAAMNAGLSVSNAKAVSGIGDSAIEYSAAGGQGNGLVIVVIKANVVFLIYVMPSPDPKALETLAGTATTRLTTA